MCVCGDEGKSVIFKIIPNKLGHIPLTVKAVTSAMKLCPKSSVFAADAVTRKLLVEVRFLYAFTVVYSMRFRRFYTLTDYILNATITHHFSLDLMFKNLFNIGALSINNFPC